MTRYWWILVVVLVCAGCAKGTGTKGIYISEGVGESLANGMTLYIDSVTYAEPPAVEYLRCSRCHAELPEGRTEGWCEDCVRPDDVIEGLSPSWPPDDLIMARSTVLSVIGSDMDDLIDALPALSAERLDLIVDVKWDNEVVLRMHRSGEIIVCGEQVAFEPEGCERVWEVMTVALEAYGYDDGKVAAK